jgi:hypothetical protein
MRVWSIALAGASLAVAVAAAAQEWSGQGAQTRELELAAGWLRVEFETPMPGPMRLGLRTAAGESVWEATIDGPAATHWLMPLAAPGRYELAVQGTGAWVVRWRPASPTEVELRARSDAQAAANGASTGGALLSGLVGGLALGPIGAGLAVARAGRGPVAPPPTLERALSAQPPVYAGAFRRAYADAVRRQRRTAALVGGAIGTGIFTTVALIVTGVIRVGPQEGSAGAELP